MGEWNQTCAVTHTPIIEGDPVIAFFVAEAENNLDLMGYTYSSSYWAPVSLHIRAEYDSYGFIRNVEDTTYSRWWLAQLEAYLGQNVKEYNDLKDLDREGILTFTRLVSGQSSKLSIMLVHKWAFNTIMDMEKGGFPELSYKFFEERSFELANIEDNGPDDVAEVRRKLGIPSSELESNIVAEMVNQTHPYIRNNPNRGWISYIYYNQEYNEFIRLAEFSQFTMALFFLRIPWAPQPGQGSQSEDFNLHRQLAEKVVEQMDKREREMEDLDSW